MLGEDLKHTSQRYWHPTKHQAQSDPSNPPIDEVPCPLPSLVGDFFVGSHWMACNYT